MTTTTTAMMTTTTMMMVMLKMFLMINCSPISTFPNDSEARLVDRINMFLLESIIVDHDGGDDEEYDGGDGLNDDDDDNLPDIDENDVQTFLGKQPPKKAAHCTWCSSWCSSSSSQ